MMKQMLLKYLLAMLLTATAPLAFAANEGTAVGVRPDAVAQINSADRILKVGADVSVGELIITGTVGQVQIVFDDNTRVVVGPRSTLLIEAYLMASSNIAQQLTINALGGSFRFITGNSPKPAYSIKTPTAAIAVRGTEFDFVVAPRSTKVMLYDGALQVCSTGGACEQLTQSCEVALVTRSAADRFLRNNPARAPLSQEFRYAQFQSALLAPFRVNMPSRCVESPPPSANEGASGPMQTPTAQPTTPRPFGKN